jgi:hypothetical protein
MPRTPKDTTHLDDGLQQIWIDKIIFEALYSCAAPLGLSLEDSLFGVGKVPKSQRKTATTRPFLDRDRVGNIDDKSSINPRAMA